MRVLLSPSWTDIRGIRFITSLLLSLFVPMLIAGCAATRGAPPAAEAGPWRTSTVGGEDGVMLQGHDAVAYFTQGDAVPGNPAISVVHLGVKWRFASESNRDAFLREPQRYRPQFGGWCSNGINYSIPGGGGGGPNTWRIYRGRLYVFGGQRARDHFEMDTELNLERGHRYWREEVAGSNPTTARMKRLASRVPHYKSDAALDKEYEEKLAAGTLPVKPGGKQVVPAAP